MTSDTRTYRMRKRAQDVAETRRRIVEAAVHLHGTVGPANTTISAVADEAGVQRSTVYRHFPDDQALFGACTSHWLAQNPWPRNEEWDDEKNPAARLGIALDLIYRYYANNRQMLFNAWRDLEVAPPFVGELMRAQVESAHASLMQDWPADAPLDRLAAAVAHAIDFRSWQTFDDAGLPPSEAARLMTEMVSSLAE